MIRAFTLMTMSLTLLGFASADESTSVITNQLRGMNTDERRLQTVDMSITATIYQRTDTSCSGTSQGTNIIGANTCFYVDTEEGQNIFAKGVVTPNGEILESLSFFTDIGCTAPIPGFDFTGLPAASPTPCVCQSTSDADTVCAKFTLSNSTTPNPGPPSGSSSKDCFAGTEQVSLETGGTKDISEVGVGERVMVSDKNGNLMYSDVVFVPHKKNNEQTTFVKLTTANGHELKVTTTHLIPSGLCDVAPNAFELIHAEKLNVDMCVNTVSGKDRIVSITQDNGRGVYTVVTAENSGLIVVNGIIASSFGKNHMFVNMFYEIHRVLFAFLPWVLDFGVVAKAGAAVGDLSASALSL